MKLRLILPLIAGAFLISSQFARATALGLSTDPMGSAWQRGQPDTAFGIWDEYTGFNFIDDTPDSSGGFSSSGLDQSTAVGGGDGGLYNNIGPSGRVEGPDVIFSGDVTPSFVVSGGTSFTVQGVYLQIKRAGSTTSLIGLSTPTLNGIAYDGATFTSGSLDETSESGNWSVTTYFWGASLVGQNITSFNITFTTPQATGIDGIVIDAAAVPEPATWALGLAGLAVVAVMRKRRLASL